MNTDNSQQHSRKWTWLVRDTYEQLAHCAAGHICAVACEAIRLKGSFHFIATGGETVRGIYNLLAESHTAAWNAWHLYLTDERCMDAHHADRNSAMLCRELLSRVPIPDSQVHLIDAELGPVVASREYAKQIAHIAAFDLVLMCLGEDGHVASLFPGRASTEELVVQVLDSPKPPRERVSLSPSALRRADAVLVVASGARKCSAVQRIADNDSVFGHVVGPNAKVTVLVDSAASGNGD
jgi:6-phosphogluconolactonase